ncbi:hypothetical protein L208DRAFT_1083189, partial [Tricholoma matsutake]
DHVLLATAHHQQDYMQKKDGHMAKFMPRFNSPFKVTMAFPEASTLLNSSKIHQTFHFSLLQPCLENDDKLFPSQALERPGPIMTANGETKYYIDEIIDE